MAEDAGMRGEKEKGTANQNFLQTAGTLADFFQMHREDLRGIMDMAVNVRNGILAVDSFIQRHTSVVCTRCRKVCCINRHAYLNTDDLIYIYALGLKPPRYQHREESDACQFLSPGGCSLDRTVRPSGCNWYFCNPLLSHMEEDSAAGAYGEFDSAFQELVDLWMEMVGEFRVVFRRISGYEIG